MRQAGILNAISSLPGTYGVGDFGVDAYKFIDLIHDNGIRLWQILPLHPLGYGDSPYQPYSSYAGDEIYISINGLVELGLINKQDINDKPIINDRSDFDTCRTIKNKYLKLAYINHKTNIEIIEEFNNFKKGIIWLDSYSKFITLKKKNDGTSWTDWPTKEKEYITNPYVLSDELNDNIEYEKFVQYIFYKQWLSLKKYANDKGIQIMGDMPIYVGLDSSDVYEDRKSFLLDDDGRPTYIAGVPPDFFSKDGQRWGNPIYDWEYLKKNKFTFWINRLKWANQIYDITRIDHFRAFDTYWKIPVTCPTAREGEWIEAPGYELFDTIYKEIPDIKIVAEDLGDLRKEVIELRDYYNLSGMKIIQFTLDPNENNNNFKEKKNTIVYSGTHDNSTVKGWFKTQRLIDKFKLKRQLKKYHGDNVIQKINDLCVSSDADLVILPTQDILEYDDYARMNIPGTIGGANWKFKLKSIAELQTKITNYKDLIKKYNR